MLLSRLAFASSGPLRAASRRVAAPVAAALSSVAPPVDMSKFNQDQVKMLEELCILVDAEDNVVGADTKKNVHLMTGPSMRPGGLPHRAFSAFVFDADGALLMQKRSAEKILFPHHWANTCCSHPLHDGATFLDQVIHGEMDGPAGTVRAARRKLEQELGIDPAQLPEDCFTFVTKVHYKAPMPGTAPLWGEHEIDYILIARPPAGAALAVAPNPEEVAEARWFTRDEIRALVASAAQRAARGGGGEGEEEGELISPWFGEIEELLLPAIWDDLDNLVADDAIHRCYQSDTEAR